MKKVIIFFLLIVLIGCSKPTTYDYYVTMLKQETVSSENIPFDVNIYTDEIDESKWIYQVVIDNAQEEIKDIKALVIHDVKTKDVFPSIGIVDEPITLNEQTKGINLIGYVDKKEEIEFKILVETYNQKYVIIYNYR